MLLGKRPRPPMKRTTSLSEISFDLGDSSSSSSHHQQTNPAGIRPKLPDSGAGSGGFTVDQRFLTSMVSPINYNNNNNKNNNNNNDNNNNNNNRQRRHSADILETPHFLKSCGLCKRSLVPGRDIYMYRGDSAFCSLECRQQQMNHDERKEKCSYTASSSKKQAAAAAAAV